MGEIRVASTGDVWVEEYVPFYEERTARWWIFASNGEILGQVSIPEELTIRAIGSDHILGTTRDSLGVSYVVRHGLLR